MCPCPLSSYLRVKMTFLGVRSAWPSLPPLGKAEGLQGLFKALDTFLHSHTSLLMVRHLIPAGLHSRILRSLPAGARAPVCDIHVACHTHGNVGYDTHTVSYILCNMCNVIYFMSYSTSSQHSQGLPADLPGYSIHPLQTVEHCGIW